MRPIVARLNFHFSVKDFFIAFVGLFNSKSTAVLAKMNKFFPTNQGILFTNHGRTGIKLVLESLGLERGAKVGVLVYNCHTVFSAIEKAGLKPVFIDCDQNYRLSINDLKAKASILDAIVVTHLFGIPADMTEILKIMGEKPVVEDCAHSFLIENSGKHTGTFGVAGVFSFGQSKFPSAGEGGFVVFNDKKYFERAKSSFIKLNSKSVFSQIKEIAKAYVSALLLSKYLYGLIIYKLKNKLEGKFDVNQKFSFKEYPVNLGFLAVLNSRLKHIKATYNRQIQIRNALLSSLGPNAIFSDDERPFFMIPIQVNTPEKSKKVALHSGIELGNHFSNSILWASERGYKNDCKIAENLIEKTITIPCHYRLTEKEIIKYQTFIKNENNL